MKAAPERSQKVHVVEADGAHMLPDDKPVSLSCQDVTTVTSPV